MPTIIDELIVLFKIDGSQAKKAADASTATVQKVTKAAKVSAADQERIANSQEQRRREREKRDAKVANQKEKDEKKAITDSQKRAEEYGDKVKSVALGLSGAFLGFESLKGVVTAFNQIVTSTAALGRNAADLGTSVQELQTWELAVKKAGGTAEDADAAFSTLSQSLTGALLRGQPSAFYDLLNQFGVAAKDAKGQIRPLNDMLLELGDHMQARGISQANAFNLFTGAGGNKGVFDLLYSPDRNKYLNESALQAVADPGRVKRAEDAAAAREKFKAGAGAWTSNVADSIMKVLSGAGGKPDADEYKDYSFDSGSKEFKKLHGSPFYGKISSTEEKYDLPEGLLGRLLMQESGLNPNAKNISGATGIAQLMPKWFPDAGKDPNADIEAAGLHLATLLKTNHGDIYRSLADYNDGHANVARHIANGDLPAETLQYVAKVGNVHGATPDIGGGGGGGVSHDNSVSVQTGNVTIITQATDANGIAKDFSQAMRDKGALISQSNYGMTP